MKTVCSTLMLMAVCFLVVGSYCYAEKVHVIDGVIERVTDDAISVHGKYYETAGVTVVDASGNTLRKTALQRDKRVKLFFHDGVLKSILIYEYMIE